MKYQDYLIQKNKGKRLTSKAPSVKLTVQHTPTRGDKISESLKKHHANKRRFKTITRQQAEKLAGRWGAKYDIERGI